MGGPAEVVGEALEASRLKEQLLGREARPLSRAATLLVEAAAAGRVIHLLADRAAAGLAAHLALHARRGGLPARALDEDDPAPDALARAVGAFVQAGDVVVVLAPEGQPGLDRALAQAHARGAARVALAGEGPGAALVALVDVGVVVPSNRPAVLAAVVLALGHVLVGVAQDGAAREAGVGAGATGGAGAGGPPPTPPMPTVPGPQGGGRGRHPTEPLVIDEDPELASEDLTHDLDDDEATMLAEAVEVTAAPPTTARPVRRRSTPEPSGGGTAAPGLIRFRCGGCQEPIVVEQRYAGRRGQCPHCRAEFQIPAETGGGGGTSDVRGEAARAPRPGRPGPGRGPSAQGSASGVESRAGRASAAAERRRAMRIAVKDAIVRYAREGFPGGDAYHEPRALEDLSLTGMRFVGRDKDYEVGDVLCFAIDCPAFPEPVRIKGEVRRVVRARDGAGWSAGVRFVQYVGDAEARVRRLLENVQLRAVRRR